MPIPVISSFEFRDSSDSPINSRFVHLTRFI